MKRYFLVLLSLYFFPFTNLAQEINREVVTCAYDDAKESLSNNLVIKEQAANYEKAYQKAMQNEETVSVTNELYTLPIVVHILHGGEEIGSDQNRSDEQLITLINQANNRFKHSSGKTFDNPYSGINTNIELCLATSDPSGNYTTGFIRYYAPDLSVGPYYDLFDFIQDTRWNPEKYCNIYMMSRMTNAAGVYLGGPDTDVTVYSSLFVHSGLVAHEIGHYLSLDHTFSGTCKNDNCLEDGDKICDTPPKNQSNLAGGSCGNPANNCTTDEDDLQSRNPYRPKANGGLGDQLDLLENYMDYSSRCWDAFTVGQSARMRFNIANSRDALINHSTTACANRTPPANEIAVLNVQINKSTCSPTVTEMEVMVKNNGSATVNNLVLDVVLNGLQQASLAQSAVIAPNATHLFKLNQNLNLSAGDNTLLVSSRLPNGNTDGYKNNDTVVRSIKHIEQGINIPYEESFDALTYAFSDNLKFRQATNLEWQLGINSSPLDQCLDKCTPYIFGWLGESDQTATMILPIMDFQNLSDPMLSFDYGYIKRFTSINNTFSIKLISENCTKETVVWSKTGNNLSTGGQPDGTFQRITCEELKTIDIDLSPYANERKIIVEFIAEGRFYSILHLDNIRITNANIACETEPINLTGLLNTSISRKTTKTITSSSQLKNRVKVSLQAGQSITLQPGFNAVLGTSFSAKIGDCSENPSIAEKISATQKTIKPLVQSVSPFQDILIYPNPITDNFTLELPRTQKLAIKLFNATGKPVLEQNISSTTVINLTDSTPGIYFLSIADIDSGNQEVRKIMKIN